jgi:nitroimidazol reductase NimA-like FMN-containing flavoprotein (pyridoxamine 5'-phosphate oxidase superfamily)
MTRKYDNQPPNAFQRLPKYARGDDWIRSFLREQKIGHTAYAWDDQPFVHPNLFWFDEENHQIVFHGNLAGRIRSGIEKNPKVSLEVSETGKLLPSNVALEFALQYRSVMVFGTVRVLDDPEEARRGLYALITKYFPGMAAGREYREITEKELRTTTVYAIQIESWSGKENWKDGAAQSKEWAPLDRKWFAPSV